MNGSWLIRSDCTSGPRLKSLLSETIAKKPRDKSKGIEINEFAGNGCNAHSSSNETRKRNTHAVSTEDGNKEMKKMKTAKSNTLENGDVCRKRWDQIDTLVSMQTCHLLN